MTFDWENSSGRRDDILLGGIHPALLVEIKNFRQKNESEFPRVPIPSITFILYKFNT